MHESILKDWKRNVFSPVYWLEGEEPYFIDQLTHYAENSILPAEEAAFNLSIVYGKDIDVTSLINLCKQFPMMSERKVVILKEAQQLKDIDKLQSYIEKPLTSTILIIAHKYKKLDGRSKLNKALKQHAVVLSTKKLYDNQLLPFAQQLAQKYKLTFANKAIQLLVDSIGSDLSRIDNEMQKLVVSLNGRLSVNENDIETFIGISKEYNVFELQNALSQKNFEKAIRIVQYFASNTKANPIQLNIPVLFTFFSKVYAVHGLADKSEASITNNLGIRFPQVVSIHQASKNYAMQSVEKILVLLQHYNLKSIGMYNDYTSDEENFKELILQIFMC